MLLEKGNSGQLEKSRELPEIHRSNSLAASQIWKNFDNAARMQRNNVIRNKEVLSPGGFPGFGASSLPQGSHTRDTKQFRWPLRCP